MPASSASLQLKHQIRAIAHRLWRDPIARSSAVAIGVTIVGSGLGYATQITLARLLGPEGYGDYTYSTAWLNVAQLIAALDMGGGALRFIGQYAKGGAWGLLRGFIGRARAVVAGTSFACTLLAVALLLGLRGHMSAGRLTALLVTCGAIVPAASLALESNVLQGFHRTLGARIPTNIVRPLVLLAALSAALGAGRMLRPPAVLAANAAGLWVAAALSIWWVQRVRPAELRRAPAETRTGEWLRMSTTLLSGSVLQMILSQQSDVIVVGSLLSSRAAGLYSVAGQLASLVTFGVGTVNQLAAPQLAAFAGDLRAPAFAGVVRRVSLVNWTLSLPAAAGLALAGPWILRTFGHDYSGAYPTFCVLLVSQVVSAAWGGLAGTMLAMIGYHRAAAAIIGASAALNLALTALLTPRFGIVGAAAATTLATVARAVVMQLYVLRGTGLWLLPGRLGTARAAV